MAAAGPTILVVDDNQATRDLLCDLLTDEGYAVECAGRGRAAIARVQAGGVSLVLLDWRLPDVTGAAVLQTLAEQGHAVPVIILSGEQVGTPRPAGAVATLGKPFEIDDLLAVLGEHCPLPSREA
jgi:DNA-binding response OmpR family regulator